MFAVILCALVGLAAARDQFIIGGTAATIEDYPYQGSWRSGSSHICGCVLIDTNWVLTAAHCVGNPPGTYTTGWGNADRTSLTTYGVSAITRHPNYEEGLGFSNNDIAVVASSTPIAINGVTVKSIPIAIDGTHNPTSSDCFISGWGRTCGTCPLPATLQAVQIPVIDCPTCKEQFPAAFQCDEMICVWGGVGGGIGSCNGDSGGPLRCDINGVGTLYGLTSWGVSGCDTNSPSVYARVASYASFVCSTTADALAVCAQIP